MYEIQNMHLREPSLGHESLLIEVWKWLGAGLAIGFPDDAATKDR
jgi:hypothetical protein